MTANKGTSIENFERALWKLIDEAQLPEGFKKEVYQAQDPELLGDFKKSCKILIERIGIFSITGHGQGNQIMEPVGDLLETEINGEKISGYAELQAYSEEKWIRALYQVSFITSNLSLDRFLTERLTTMFSRRYMECEPGCSVFVRQQEGFKSLPSDDSAIFEKAMTLESEIPLRVVPTEIIKTIISFIIYINSGDKTEETITGGI